MTELKISEPEALAKASRLHSGFRLGSTFAAMDDEPLSLITFS
jgi:hypothetical protein